MKPELDTTGRRVALPVALVIAGLSLMVGGATAQAADWPQFRGPKGDGRAEQATLSLPWPAEGPAELWSVPLGGGYSGIAAVGDKLYTLMSSGSDELLVAFDATDGKELWRLRTDAKRRDSFGDGPRSTPTVDQASR